MRPYHHSKASVSRYGGQWQDYLEIHSLIDSSKTGCSNLKHRMILHNVDLTAELFKNKFGSNFSNILADHINEDIGKPVSLQDWLRFCDKRHMPKLQNLISKDDFIEKEIQRSKVNAPDHISQVYDLITLPMKYAGVYGDISLSILGNSFGIELVDKIMGGPTEFETKIFDPGWCAESLVYTFFKGIPDIRSSTLGLNLDDFHGFVV